MDETPPIVFGKPSHAMPTSHLYVANCGPAVGISLSDIKKAFETFGPVVNVQLAGTSGSRVYVSYDTVENAVAARGMWNSKPCDALECRVMVIQHAVPQTQPSVSSSLHWPLHPDVRVGLFLEELVIRSTNLRSFIRHVTFLLIDCGSCFREVNSLRFLCPVRIWVYQD